MIKKITLALLLGIVFLGQVQAQSKKDKRPNVIIVITDDQGYGDLGYTGNPIIKTPNIDAFASQAVSLTNYHVGTTCAPSRAGLMTARNCNRNGVWHTIMGASILNREEVTMANVFKNSGYKTAMFGKWHLGDNHPFLPEDRGFDETFYHGGGGVGQTPDYWNNDYFDDTYFRNGKPEKVEGYCTDVWFDEAIKFIEDKKDVPFFCYLSLNAPHGPLNVPEEYYEMYEGMDSIPKKRKLFYAMITNIDDNFNKLLSKLDELKIVDNTIVIFTTDNGTASGIEIDKKTSVVSGYNAGMKGKKGSEYEGGHRVPFIMRWPKGGVEGGKTLGELTAHVDMLPTLTSMVGIPFESTKKLDGIDISNYFLKGEKPESRMVVTDKQRIHWPIKGKNTSVMQDSWRLVNGKELYDVSKDPGQKNNIADQHADRVKDMNDFYDTWWADVIKETKFSVIDLGIDPKEMITCMDIHTDKVPAWNQPHVRSGKIMKPAKVMVNFTKGGKYKISICRWPSESGLAIGDGTPAVKGTKSTTGLNRGIAIKYKKAFLKVNDNEYSVEVDNSTPGAVIGIEVKKGAADLTAWLEQEDGVLTNAYYIYVEKLN